MTVSHHETSVNYRKPYRPKTIALINSAGNLLSSLGYRGPSLDDESLMKAARKKSGLNDFGDPGFRDRMKLLIDSLENEAHLHFVGRFIIRQTMVRLLSNRLKIQHALNNNRILEIEMADPVFIVGLQRTGTTMLHRMLAADQDNFRFLASWEAMNPAPVKLHGDDPKDRIKAAKTAQKGLKYLAPDFFTIHPIDALGPEEDCMLFDFDFWSTVPEAMQRVPTFSRWIEAQDHTEAYRYYKNVLKYLYWQNPRGRWVLKTPQHMEHFEEILNIFPNAKIIQTHRDPTQVIPSFCSMVSHAYGIFSDKVDPIEIGCHWSAKALKMVNHSIDIREKASESHFIDIQYADMMNDSVGVIRRIYDFVGFPFTDETENRIVNWKRDNPQHRYGRHVYNPNDFGFDTDEVRKTFSRYSERFNIPMENKR